MASNIELSVEFVNKIYRYMKNGMSIETFMDKFGYNQNELKGILELCNLHGKQISLERFGDTIVFRKDPHKRPVTSKPDIEDQKLTHTELCVVSDTHFGNVHNQLHLLNEVYQEAYNRGIDTVLHVGDMVDGNYPNRPEQPRQQFLHGYDEQVGYVKAMYPYVDGLTTYYILGSHDETHYKNGQATVNFGLEERKDMVYLGQDNAEITINNVKIVLDHPGGGSSQYVSYKPQKRIEIIESHTKPKLLLIGHYHKSYAFTYRNIQCILVPCLCDKTQFQQKQGLQNVLGAYFLDIYSDKKGHIQYFEPEEILFGKEDVWDEPGKDKRKVKKLEITHGKY
jgi:predicted phosphodiesterase